MLIVSYTWYNSIYHVRTKVHTKYEPSGGIADIRAESGVLVLYSCTGGGAYSRHTFMVLVVCAQWSVPVGNGNLKFVDWVYGSWKFVKWVLDIGGRRPPL